MVRKRLGELLQELGYLSADQLEVALEVQRLSGKSLGEILIELSFVSPQELAQAIAHQAGKEFIDLTLFSPSFEALKIIDKNLAKQLEVLPLSVEGNTLKVALSDPFNVNVIDVIKRRSGLEVHTFVADRESIFRSIEIYYEQLTKPIEEQIKEVVESAKKGEASIPTLVDLIMNNGIIDRATDIHISPETVASHVFYRIDGVMHHYYSLPKEIHPSVVSRVKIVSGMDISEQRLPQDGGFSYTFLGESYDVRVSTVPTAYGENVVMRMLPKNLSLFNLKNLGFEADVLRSFEEVISMPYGMVLVTGPTGSGKTTTLYAALRSVDFLRKNILTVEDPVEYKFPFIKQTQVNTKAGYDFARAIRHFLRQDPDVILVGEVRDEDTAEMAVRAAITGHLVLSTLHTNDAVSTIPRLVDLGVKEYMIASGVLAITAQRLVRKICSFCKQEYAVKKESLIRFGFRESMVSKYVKGDKAVIAKGNGCDHCKGTGYLGRVAVVELLRIDEELGDMIVRKAPPLEIMQRAVSKGMRTLKEDGLIKILRKVTTPQEIRRVIG